MKITEHNNRTPGDEEWHRLSPIERFEWLEEHCWILPPEERWIERDKPNTATAPPKERDNEKFLREAIDLGVRLAEEDALFRLTMKARQVRAAELERRRPHLIVNTTLH